MPVATPFSILCLLTRAASFSALAAAFLPAAAPAPAVLAASMAARRSLALAAAAALAAFLASCYEMRGGGRVCADRNKPAPAHTRALPCQSPRPARIALPPQVHHHLPSHLVPGGPSSPGRWAPRAARWPAQRRPPAGRPRRSGRPPLRTSVWAGSKEGDTGNGGAHGRVCVCVVRGQEPHRAVRTLSTDSKSDERDGESEQRQAVRFCLPSPALACSLAHLSAAPKPLAPARPPVLSHRHPTAMATQTLDRPAAGKVRQKKTKNGTAPVSLCHQATAS